MPPNPTIIKPVATTGMLIRKPVSEVFLAFVNPAITTHFWFTKSSSKLVTGKNIIWTWEMYGASAEVAVKSIVKNKRIIIEWGEPGNRSTVTWDFIPYQKKNTFVSITSKGFVGNQASVISQSLDMMGGFSLVLCGAKAYLEHGIELQLVLDRFPKGLKKH